MSEYDEKLCKARCKTVDEKLKNHEDRLNGHSERLDRLEQRGAAVDIKLENLCVQIKDLVSTLKWGFGILVTITLFVLAYLLKVR